MNNILERIGKETIKEILKKIFDIEDKDFYIGSERKDALRIEINKGEYGILNNYILEAFERQLHRYNLRIEEWSIYREELKILIVFYIGEKK